MNNYTVTKAFKLPVQATEIEVGEIISAYEDSVNSLVKGVAFPEDRALWSWIGSGSGLDYMVFESNEPDPVPAGGGTGAGVASGLVPIASGVDFVTITGLGLSAAPVNVVITIEKPLETDYNIFATLRAGTLTTDGFTCDLSAETDKVGYQLSYVIVEG